MFAAQHYFYEKCHLNFFITTNSNFLLYIKFFLLMPLYDFGQVMSIMSVHLIIDLIANNIYKVTTRDYRASAPVAYRRSFRFLKCLCVILFLLRINLQFNVFKKKKKSDQTATKNKKKKQKERSFSAFFFFILFDCNTILFNSIILSLI